MPPKTSQATALLHVAGLSIGMALAAVVVRALFLPFEFLVSGQASVLAAEGGFVWYLSRTLVWAVVAGLAGAVVGVVHNEFVKRRL